VADVRSIVAVTGIRSEYDIMSTVFAAIKADPRLDLRLIVTGAHLADAFGHTVEQIESDGFVIADRIQSLLNSDEASARVRGMGVQLQGLVQSVDRLRPDMLLVLGDREEAMTTALVGAYMNIPVAHVSGGDRVVGNVDDQLRHAVTKLAHLHFVTNQDSAERVLKLGEQPFRVRNVGNPGLDRLLSEPELSAEELSRRLGFRIDADRPLIMLIQHALSSAIEDAYSQMRETLEAVAELGLPTVLSYPNSDAGGQQMIRAINEFAGLPHLHISKNIPRPEFVNLMRRASVMLGNSSAGILEAPLLKLPVVNVGRRQTGRLTAGNVEFVPHDRARIASAVRRAIEDVDYRSAVAACVNPYGDGHAAEKIAAVLASVPIDETLLIKDITY
jgi:GDP/UDP-N,N'-diacetylbacillosamine 2-epimerase (hydrolysing)